MGDRVGLRRGFFVACLTATWAIAAVVGAAEPPSDLGNRVARLVRELADDQFVVRDAARRELVALLADPDLAEETRLLLLPLLGNPDVPFDVREVVKAVGKFDVDLRTVGGDANSAETAKFNAWFAALDAETAATRLAELFDELDADSFEKREQAAVRLKRAAQATAASGPLLWQIHERLVKGGVDPDSVRRLRSTWEAALQTWVTMSPAPAWKPPIDVDQEIEAALDRLVAASADSDLTPWIHPAAIAERELIFLLTIEDWAPRVSAAVRRRLEPVDLKPAVAGKLERIDVWTRPAMAAEFWQGGRHHSTQHLLIGVPNQPEGAPRPSLFDRCDDQFARCVSGNSLSPGLHPVGVFFPHPSELQNGAQFHLVNLPTPRRRIAYDFEAPVATSSTTDLQQIDLRRRREITARTLARFENEKHRLDDREIDMLAHLDPEASVKFAAKYLQNMDDQRYESGSPQAFGNGSLHGWLCYVLATFETPAAGQAVAAAIDKQRVLEPTMEKPYRIDWVAALDLAETAPWPEVDRWLAAQLDRTEPLNIREPNAADVGASCAARLLIRAGRDLEEFSLERREFPELIDLGNPGYRFTRPEGRAAVRTWWRERQAADAGAKSP